MEGRAAVKSTGLPLAQAVLGEDGLRNRIDRFGFGRTRNTVTVDTLPGTIAARSEGTAIDLGHRFCSGGHSVPVESRKKVSRRHVRQNLIFWNGSNGFGTGHPTVKSAGFAVQGDDRMRRSRTWAITGRPATTGGTARSKATSNDASESSGDSASGNSGSPGRMSGVAPA